MALEFIRKDSKISLEVYRAEKKILFPINQIEKVLNIQFLQGQPTTILPKNTLWINFESKV